MARCAERGFIPPEQHSRTVSESFTAVSLLVHCRHTILVIVSESLGTLAACVLGLRLEHKWSPPSLHVVPSMTLDERIRGRS